MKSSVAVWFILSLLISSGCSSIKTYSDYDPSVNNFTQYKTFRWMTPQKEVFNSPVQNPITEKRIKNAVEKELSQKGLKVAAEDEKPDFWVAYHASTKERLKNNPAGMPYDYSYGYWSGDYSSSPTTYQYTEGTLILDFVDAKTNTLFWRGVAVSALDKPIVSEDTIRNAMRSTLEKYPPSLEDRKNS